MFDYYILYLSNFLRKPYARFIVIHLDSSFALLPEGGLAGCYGAIRYFDDTIITIN